MIQLDLRLYAWNEYVFKLRDLNDSVNTKGARVEQAQKKTFQ